MFYSLYLVKKKSFKKFYRKTIIFLGLAKNIPIIYFTIKNNKNNNVYLIFYN
jgi:hypothetical protein